MNFGLEEKLTEMSRWHAKGESVWSPIQYHYGIVNTWQLVVRTVHPHYGIVNTWQLVVRTVRPHYGIVNTWQLVVQCVLIMAL